MKPFAACPLLLVGASVLAAPPVLVAHSDEPRAFGYSVGDVVTRVVRLQVPPGLSLDPDSLPRPGARGRALELQQVVLQRSLGGTPESLRLEYQVFLAPREVRVLEMPALVLAFRDGAREQSVRVDAWPVTVAPLTPPDPSMRSGLGEMRPDRPPPLLDNTAAVIRLSMELAAITGLLAYLAHVYWVPPWSKQHRPFDQAWRALRAMPAEAPAARAALERLHAALNFTAGEVLFASGVERFVARDPRFAPLQADLGRFFAISREAFFGRNGTPIDTEWVAGFCRRCRDVERGAA